MQFASIYNHRPQEGVCMLKRSALRIHKSSPYHAFQDEFKFFMEDAKCKLLLVPSEGNSTAEKAASDLQVPIATLKITSSSGKHPCSLAALPFLNQPAGTSSLQ